MNSPVRWPAPETDPTVDLDAAEALEVILDVLPDAVIVVHDGHIAYASRRIEQMTGSTVAELIGRPLEVLVPDDRRRSHEEHRRVYERRPSVRPMGQRLDTRLLRRDGTTVPVDIALAPFVHAGERATIAVVRDATEQRRQREELRTAAEHAREVTRRLRAHDATKNVFLRALAHDIRAPLSVISAVAQTLAARPAAFDEAGIRDLMARVRRQAQRMERMLDDLLDLERLTSAPRLEPQRTDVAALVSAIVAETTDRPVELDLDAVTASVDPVAVGRIVTNLVGNAATHTPIGTRICVRLRRLRDRVLITVEDDGPGVDDDLKRALRSGPVGGPLRLASGHGLGLSIVRGFAELHGGTLDVSDRPGGGARFTVELAVDPGAGGTPRDDGVGA